MAEALSRHPHVEPTDTLVSGLRFVQDGRWHREVTVGDPTMEVCGLIELMDNNPMVCADRVGVPGPVATLALIALGPLARAGLLRDEPVMVINREMPEEPLTEWLTTAGFAPEVLLNHEPVETGTVLVASVMTVLDPIDGRQLLDLYDEAYARSVFVRRVSGGSWDHVAVQGQPFAYYRVTQQSDDDGAFVKIQVMADLDGKLGAAQLVHAMNVMAGFEESLPYTQTLTA